MKIKINAKDLQNMLKKAKGLQLNKLNLDLEFQKGLLIKNDILIMNNLNTQLESKFYVDVIEPGEVLIPEQTLNMLENFKENHITITDDKIIHKTRELKFIPGQLENFVVMNNEISDELFTITEKELSHLLEVNYATSNDETIPILKGIEINNHRFTALNGYYASTREGNFQCNNRVLISKDVWKLLLKIINQKSEKLVKVCWDKKEFIQFEFEDFIIKGNIYTDYNKNKFNIIETVIFDTPNCEFIINGKQLYNSLKIMDKLSIDKQTVFLNIEDNKIKLETRTNLNVMSDEIEVVDKDGDNFRIAFNIKYLLAVTNQYKNENVKVELKGPIFPMIFKGNNKLDLVMPIRVRDEV